MLSYSRARPGGSLPTPPSFCSVSNPPAAAASSTASTCSSPTPMPADRYELTGLEAACAELAAAGQPVTFR